MRLAGSGGSRTDPSSRSSCRRAGLDGRERRLVAVEGEQPGLQQAPKLRRQVAGERVVREVERLEVPQAPELARYLKIQPDLLKRTENTA